MRQKHGVKIRRRFSEAKVETYNFETCVIRKRLPILDSD